MAGAKLGEVRVTLAIEGSTTRVAAVQLTRGKTITAGLLLRLLPRLTQDLTETLERLRSREEHPAGRKPL
ncbi:MULTISPECIES: hypothetical protein [unclassified Rathayibacter]|uniref:hypothetical protein n=1 Tax=unclassified Rathayibacter TaxID=2609250 RepID=UPI000CE7AB66|nr:MULTISPECIES: hypothetical protein [unclassified Rathayibacter]PPF15226.1 hypothetical protein C5B95_16495 [Rathayibacter sp. AY1A7]PPH84892.1 hypothetical protein C5C50_00960 [Rathayibacter sp. AY1D9]